MSSKMFDFFKAKQMKFIFAVLLGALLSGCASGSITVNNAPNERKVVSSLTVVKGSEAAIVDPEVEKTFVAQLHKDLYVQGPFTTGEELTLSWRFVQFNAGSQAARYFIGFGAGKGTMTIEVTYLAPDGTELSKVNVGGEISGGFFGGNLNEAINKAAQEAAAFTISNFSDMQAKVK